MTATILFNDQDGRKARFLCVLRDRFVYQNALKTL